jgi:hypothetical protein
LAEIDRDTFVAACRELKSRGWSFASYNAALRSWIATMAIIEVGYDGEGEEYEALELAARDYLEELMVLSPGSREKIEADLRAWDERFRAATIERDKPFIGSRDEAGWWRYRRPVKWRNDSLEEWTLKQAALAQAPPGAVLGGSSVSADGKYGAVLTLLPSAGDYPMDDLFERVGDEWSHPSRWRRIGGGAGGGVTWASSPGRGVLRWSAAAPPERIPDIPVMAKAHVPWVRIAWAGRKYGAFVHNGWFYLVIWDSECSEDEPRVIGYEPGLGAPQR